MATTKIWDIKGRLDSLINYAANPDKTDGIVAFHAMQSFKPGEVTPKIAHEIGKRLAEGMWGDRFEVVIATHLNKEHLHNHLLISWC
ncbi:MAG: relaxase/mobilization nuclease domain-containing protein [Clostridia bacterium]|nr:relaxase/mobilization nuclease domain-containing protein [Clostridia bacterium]